VLYLEELAFVGIGRFVDEQIIPISELRNFTELGADNKNTNSSSGSGKTTVFNSLDYLLGINDLPTTVLQSRLTKTGMRVRGKFKWDDVPLEITRSKSGLKIDINSGETVIEGSNALAEEKLDEILGMSRDLFRKILHKRQKEGGFFMDFTPKKTHSFLSDCMKLGEFTKKAKKVDDKITTISENMDQSASELLVAGANLRATQDAMLSLGLPPVKEITKEMILELKEKYDRSGIRFKDVESRIQQAEQEQAKSRPSTNVIPYDGRNRESLESRRKEIEAKSRSLLLEEQDRQTQIRSRISEKSIERSKIVFKIQQGTTAKGNATKLVGEIKQIRDSKCPTCEQAWHTESSKVTEQSKLSELAKHKEAIVESMQAAERQDVLNVELSVLQEQLAPMENHQLSSLNEELLEITKLLAEEKQKEKSWIDSSNYANRILMADFDAKSAALRLQHALEIGQVRGQLDIDRRSFELAVGSLKAYEEASARYEATKNSLKIKEENFTKQKLAAEIAVAGFEKELLLAEEVRKAIKMYVSYSFDGALETIGENATKIIACIPNMRCATIRFEGTKETQDGKIKEEVNAIIDMDGEIGIPIKSLSGGERTAVDLAVDLAVIDFIESKTGKGINIFNLDEPFSGLGSVEIEMVLEVLKNSNTNKKIIIVDHNPEVKQMVHDRIIVVRDGLTSRIEKAA
jgi:DNA repair exonuclease SbcCD ATPase subunit